MEFAQLSGHNHDPEPQAARVIAATVVAITALLLRLNFIFFVT
ncbi:hypothetical protein [Ferrithrix thermotolerans]|nr:hypothetical protein [Ferrithrix thermotolerans]